MFRKMWILVIAAGLLSVIGGCAINPATGEPQLMLVTMAEQKQIGAQYAPEIQKQLGGEIDHNGLQQYVDKVGDRVVQVSHMPELEWEFTAVQDDSVNASALPGGYIFITEGMLLKLDREDQLAAILAHEAAHVTAQHSANMMSRQIGINLILSAAVKEDTPKAAVYAANIGTQLLTLKFSRDHEVQADKLGIRYLVKAGYSPYAMIEVMEILERQGGGTIDFLSTHPSPENRRGILSDYIVEMGYTSSARTSKQIYRQNVLVPLGK